jgi:hypothetical protein
MAGWRYPNQSSSTSTERILQRGDRIGEVEIEATSTATLPPTKG